MLPFQMARRRFFQFASSIGAWALQGPGPSAPVAQTAREGPIDRTRVKYRKPYIAIQVGAVSFVDEGTDKVLDIFQERAHVNTLWLNTYTYERGTGGRQIPGHPFPDHGVQAPDTDYQGGAFYDYNPKFFERTCLNEFRSRITTAWISSGKWSPRPGSAGSTCLPGITTTPM